MGHSEIFKLAEMKGDVFIQHHSAVQPLKAIPKLAKLPDHSYGSPVHCTTERQPAKADHLSSACFEREI